MRYGYAFGYDRYGITLIELLAVLAIMSLLITLAYPAYQDTVRKSRRIDAASLLFKIQLEQERYRALHQHYAESLTELGWVTDHTISGGGYYQISLLPVTDPLVNFRAQAVPDPGTDQVNDRCGILAVNEDGPDRDVPGQAGCWPG